MSNEVVKQESSVEKAHQQKPSWYYIPKSRVTENDGKYEVQVQVPGVSKDQVKIILENETLVVSADIKNDTATDYKLVYAEYDNGSYQKRFKLPVGVEFNKISADVKDGILTIGIPKSEDAKPKQIVVE